MRMVTISLLVVFFAGAGLVAFWHHFTARTSWVVGYVEGVPALDNDFAKSVPPPWGRRQGEDKATLFL